MLDRMVLSRFLSGMVSNLALMHLVDSQDLWICLICGNIGCGRYVGGHSHK